MKMQDRNRLLETLAQRFADNGHRHPRITWDRVLARIEKRADALESLQAMEASGGEPDVIGSDKGSFVFCDCSPESPAGRRSLCYDGAALKARKANKPKGSAVEAATAMGIELLTEAQYRALQELEDFDTKTSSWVATPDDVRSRGGALFGDCRFGRVFIYHNGAESYYAARGFRGRLLV